MAASTPRAHATCYRGRKVEIALPAPVWIGRRSASSIIVRYGMGVKFLDELRGRPLADDLIQEAISAFRDLQPGTTLDSDARGARLRIGQSFIADIDFHADRLIGRWRGVISGRRWKWPIGDPCQVGNEW